MVDHDPVRERAPAATAGTPGLARLTGALTVSMSGFALAVFTPLGLLLTLRLVDIAGPGAAAAFGVVTGFGALAALVTNPLAGRISDRTTARFGRRRIWILVGAACGALALLGAALATTLWQVALAWVAVQVSFNVQLAATSGALADHTPPERLGTVSGVLGLIGPLGPLLGYAVVGVLPDSEPVRWGAVAAIAAVAGVVAVVLLRDRGFVPGTDDPPMSLRTLLSSYWLDPRRHPAFARAWSVRFLVTCAYAATTYHAFLLVDRFGMGQADVAHTVLLASGITVAALAVTSVVSGVVSDRIRRQKPFVVAAGTLAAAALVALAYAPSVGWFLVACGVLGVGSGLFAAVDGALCVRVLPSRRDAGRDYAVINIANTLPQSVVPFAAPALLAVGGYPAMYLVLAALALVGAFVVRRIPEIGREDDPRFAPIIR